MNRRRSEQRNGVTTQRLTALREPHAVSRSRREAHLLEDRLLRSEPRVRLGRPGRSGEDDARADDHVRRRILIVLPAGLARRRESRCASLKVWGLSKVRATTSVDMNSSAAPLANDGGRRPERHQRAKMVVVTNPSEGKPSMGKSIQKFAAVTRVGLDLAKKVFQVHAVDASGEIAVARKLTRGRLVAFFSEPPPCVVAMEACRDLGVAQLARSSAHPHPCGGVRRRGPPQGRGGRLRQSQGHERGLVSGRQQRRGERTRDHELLPAAGGPPACSGSTRRAYSPAGTANGSGVWPC